MSHKHSTGQDKLGLQQLGEKNLNYYDVSHNTEKMIVQMEEYKQFSIEDEYKFQRRFSLELHEQHCLFLGTSQSHEREAISWAPNYLLE